jgi:hypothetical protein
MTKTYRVLVETNDGCKTIWYETSRAKKAPSIICERVNRQLAGLNLKRVEVDLSVPVTKLPSLALC